MKKRPNVLWICTDQQRYDTLGCTGNKFVKTPSIDALAKDGVIGPCDQKQWERDMWSSGTVKKGEGWLRMRCRINTEYTIITFYIYVN